MSSNVLVFPTLPAPRQLWFTLSGGRVFERSLSGNLREATLDRLFVAAQEISQDRRFAAKMDNDHFVQVAKDKEADLKAVWTQLQQTDLAS